MPDHPGLHDLPGEVRQGIQSFVDSAIVAFGDDLVSVILTGSAAEGRMRQTSDVNLLLVLKEFRAERADKLRDPLRVANAAIELHAMFLLEDELPAAMEAFAVRFADFAHRHRVLLGPDLFARQDPPRDALIRRLSQVLLNQQLRLRERYMLVSLREEQLARVIADAAGPLRTAAASLLHLETGNAPAPKEALAQVVREMNDARLSAALADISAAREDAALPPGKATETTLCLIELTRRLRQRVAALKG